jgi:hypothetical protein
MSAGRADKSVQPNAVTENAPARALRSLPAANFCGRSPDFTRQAGR